MKTHLCIFFLFIAALLSCSRAEIEAPEAPYQPVIELGHVAMDRDSQAWTATFEGVYTNAPNNSAFSCFAETVRSNGIMEIVGLADIPTQVGIYHFGKTPDWSLPFVPKAQIAWLIDGDQFLGMLSADSTYYQDNRVEVIRYDSVEHTVEGRFQVRLRTFYGTPAAYGLPEEISLTNGRFHLKLEE